MTTDTLTLDVIPPHLLHRAATYGGLARLDLETLLGQLAETVEDEVQTWLRRCELCALALHTVGVASTGVLAETAGLAGQTIRTMQKVGNVFCEADWYAAVQKGVYILAAKTDNPHATLEMAVDNGWKRRQLKAYLEGNTVTTIRELLHKNQTWPGAELNATVVGTYLDTLHQRLVRAVGDALAGNTLEALSVRVSLTAVMQVDEESNHA